MKCHRRSTNAPATFPLSGNLHTWVHTTLVIISGLALVTAAKSAGIGNSTLIDSLSQKNVPIKLISDPDWATYATSYNIRLPVKPAVIVIPETIQHISDSVICAKQYGVKVQAKGGGHSYGTFSMGGQDGSMVIDMQNFVDVKVDDQGIAKVGGGTRLGPMALGIHEQAKRALAHGTCPGVGLGGHATHGGFGWFSRNWGLAMDQIVSLDVVEADGNFVHASTMENPSLYYAMRGAGDSFGIVVNFYLQTHPEPESVVNWRFELKSTASSVDSSVLAFKHIQDFSHNASVVDRQIGFGVVITTDGMLIRGGYLGSEEKFNSVIKSEMLRGLPEPSNSSTEVVSWIDHLKSVGDPVPLNVTGPYTQRDNFFAKSVIVPEPGFTEASLKSYFEYVFNQGANSPVGWYAILDLYGGADSQINTKDINFSAYSYRSSMWVVQNYGYADANMAFPDAGLTFVNGLNNAITNNLPNCGAYINYIDPSLSADDAHKLYFGSELYGRLQKIKKELDPCDVFANPQSVDS